MLNTPEKIPVRTRLPLAAWAVAAVVTLVSLMSSLLAGASSFDHAHAERRAAHPAENRGASGKSLSDEAAGSAAHRPARRPEPRQDRTGMPNICA